MANEFKYTIRADDKSKQATQSAQRNMKGVEDSAKKLGNALKAAFTVGAVVAAGRAISQVASELVRAYGQQEQAERKLAAAAKQNPYLDDAAVKRLSRYAGELQKMTTIGDETSMSFMGMLASFGRTEEEIQNVMAAAIDLSAATGISLESAVRNLNKTFGGLTGELGELIPELKTLSVEQLKNGEAVDYVREQFRGMGAELTQTVNGALEQFNNKWGDFKELLGEGLAPIFLSTLEFLSDVVDGMADFVTQMRELKEARDAIASGNATTGQQLTALQADINAKERQIFTAQQALAQARARGMDVAPFEQQLRMLQQQLQALNQAASYMAMSEHYEQERAAAAQVAAERQQEIADALAPILEAIEWTNATNPSQTRLDNMAFTANEWFDDFEQTISDMTVGMIELESELDPVSLQFGSLYKMTNLAIASIEEAGEAVGEFGRTVAMADAAVGAGASGSASVGIAIPPTVAGQSGAQSFNLDALLTALGGALTSLDAAALTAVSSIASLAAVMNPLTTIFRMLLQSLGPLIDHALAPVLTMFRDLAMVLATNLVPYFQILAPILQVFSTLLSAIGSLLVVFLPIIEGLVFAFKVLATPIVAIATTITWAAQWIRHAIGVLTFWTDKDDVAAPGSLGAMIAAAVGNLWNTPDIPAIATPDIPTGGGAAASYTTGRNITVNVEINTDVIAGEGGLRDLSIMIRDEIRAAEALGV